MFQVEEASEGPGRKKRQWEDERKTTKITTSNSQQTEFKVNQGILKRAQSVRRRVQNNATCHTEKRAASGKISNTNNSSARGGRGWEMLDPVLRKQEGDLTRPEVVLRGCFGCKHRGCSLHLAATIVLPNLHGSFVFFGCRQMVLKPTVLCLWMPDFLKQDSTVLSDNV